VLALTALTWVILVPAVLCWPVVGVAGYLIWRSAKRHGDADNAQREALLAAAARSEPDAGGSTS
jgi:hypothetical protein